MDILRAKDLCKEEHYNSSTYYSGLSDFFNLNDEEIWMDDAMFIRCLEFVGEIYFKVSHTAEEREMFHHSMALIRANCKI